MSLALLRDDPMQQRPTSSIFDRSRSTLLGAGRVALGWLVLLASGCGAHEPAGRPPAPEPSSPTPRPREALERRMHTEFDAATQARDAIVAGDLARARPPLIRLAAHEFAGDVPSNWQPLVRRMQQSRRAGRERRELAGSRARSVGAVAAACSACHRDLQRGPLFFPDEPSAGDERSRTAGTEIELKARMHQHAWIARRLWQGLIGPWDGACIDQTPRHANRIGPRAPFSLVPTVRRVFLLERHGR